MRLVDADKQLEWVDSMKPTQSIWLEPVVAVETVRDLVKGSSTIDAIPVEWLNKQCEKADDRGDMEMTDAISWLIQTWQEEQEAR